MTQEPPESQPPRQGQGHGQYSPPDTGGQHSTPQSPQSQQQPGASGGRQTILPAFVKTIKPSHFITVLGGYLVFYMALLILAVVTTVGFLIGVAAGADAPAEAAEIGEFSSAIAFFTIPFQLVAIWLWGRFRYTGSADGDTVEFLGLWAPNILMLIAAAAVAIWLARLVSKRQSGPAVGDLYWGGRLVVVTASSIGAAFLTLLVTWALAYRATEDIMVAQLRVVGQATGFALFFGSLLLYLIVGLLISIPQPYLQRAARWADRLLPSATGAGRAIAVHFAVIGVPWLIGVTIWAGIEGGTVAVLTFFFWAWAALSIGFALLNTGAITAGGAYAPATGEPGGGTETMYLWTGDFSWWVILLCVVLSLVALFVTSLSWQLRREKRTDPVGSVLSWVTLPVVYAGLGLVLTLVGQVVVDVNFLIVATNFSVGPAWWNCSILLLIGLVLEVLARFVAPFVTPSLPRSMHVLLAGKRRVGA